LQHWVFRKSAFDTENSVFLDQKYMYITVVEYSKNVTMAWHFLSSST